MANNVPRVDDVSRAPLSALQREIMEALAAFPSLEETLNGTGVNLTGWAWPRDIRRAIGRTGSGSDRAALSKALRRLYSRGLVAMAWSVMVNVGRGTRFARITDPRNAFWRTDPPTLKLTRRPPRMKTVAGTRA